MKIVIFGASGSGTTTLGKSVAQQLDWVHLDADDYYWEPTDPPYQVKVPQAVKNQNIKRDFLAHENVIISGSLVTWGEYWNTAFDLAVFLYIPQETRLERLKKREQAMYGDAFFTDPQIIKNFHAFIDWAKQYDDLSFEGRNITQHKNWIKTLSCKTLEMEGDMTNEERMQRLLEEIKKHQNLI